MNVKIYNYQNQYIEAPITHDIVRIDVEIITGDEIVTFYYDNGKKAHFDAGEITRRVKDIPCGQYSVTDSKEIDEWVHFAPTEYPQNWRNNFPEQRMQKFADEKKDFTENSDSESEKVYIALSDLPDSKPVEEGNFSNEDFSKVYNRGFADGWNTLLQEIKDKAGNSDEENQ